MKELNKTIQMCAWFKIPPNERSMSADIQSVEPIKFITTDDNVETIEIKIDSIVKRDIIQFNKDTILKYICNITLYDRRMQCEIHYNTNTMLWILKRL
jgi:hypothetical protein